MIIRITMNLPFVLITRCHPPLSLYMSFSKSDHTFYSFMQEPFKALPLIWTVHEQSLATRVNQYTVNGTLEILNDWKKSFSRASVVVFPNHALPV